MIQADSAKLYVEDTGEGYPLVFVHEFGSDCREWEQQVRHFSRSYRCITYNARGYPPSESPEDDDLFGWEFAMSDLADVLRALSLPRAHIIGLSMGGYAALMFGLRQPDMVSAIVAAGTGSGSPPANLAQFRRDTAASAARFLDRGMVAMAEEMGHSPTRIQLKRKDPRGWEEFMSHLRSHSASGMATTMARYQGMRPSLYDFKDRFATMTVPVLLAVGDEDAPCIDTNLMLKATLPNAGLWVCPNTGHAINLEEPAAFNAEVERFLAAVERGSWRRGFPPGP